MDRLSVLNRLGEPLKWSRTPEGVLELWAHPPFIVTRTVGYISKAQAIEMDVFYRSRFASLEALVTVHEWSNLSDYDSECRKILQQLTQFVRPKQHELLINLGPADSLGQKVIRVTAETISRFKRIPIEIFSQDELFEERLRELYVKYESSLQAVG